MYEKHIIQIESDQIVLHRFKGNEAAIPVLMLHGSVENGRIFYTKSGKGLAPYLATQGLDVYVPDMRGKGESTPKIALGHAHTQTQQITQDIPAYLEKIASLRPFESIHFGAHSWGGVLFLAYLARFKDKRVKSMTFFGSKRKIYQTGLKKWFMIDLMWDRYGKRIAKKNGFLPAKKLRFGIESEPLEFYLQTAKWVAEDAWIDPEDGFDYQQAFQQIQLPPTLYLTGSHDKMLGFKDDVLRLKEETGTHQKTAFQLIGKTTGFNVDYDHINILTHPKAQEEVYPLMKAWMDEAMNS